MKTMAKLFIAVVTLLQKMNRPSEGKRGSAVVKMRRRNVYAEYVLMTGFVGGVDLGG